MIPKGLITSLIAVALAVSSFSATPAKADDAAKIITGLAAIAIIGAAIADATDNNRNRVTRHYTYGYGHRNHYRPHKRGYRKHAFRAHRFHHGLGYKQHRHYGFNKHY